MHLPEQELLTFKDVSEKKYVLISFPNGVVGCYRPSSDEFIQSIRNLMRECFEGGTVLVLVPVAFTEEDFLNLNENPPLRRTIQ